MILEARGRQITFPRRPLVMAIININDDSFCGDGTLDIQAALDQAANALREGADIIDIGAESARTNRGPISEDDEVSRLLPFIRAWPMLVEKFAPKPVDLAQLWPPLLSINTWRSGVIARVLPAGGDLLNDISALPDSTNAALCAEHGAALLIMHTVGQPKVPHTHVSYPDIMEALEQFFDEKIALATNAGLHLEQIVIDPGIDFAKQKDDNLAIYRQLSRLNKWNRPILLPVSRKTVIGEVLGLKNPTERDAGTIACIAAGMNRGAHIFRVHNVRAAVQAVKTLWALTSD